MRQTFEENDNDFFTFELGQPPHSFGQAVNQFVFVVFRNMRVIDPTVFYFLSKYSLVVFLENEVALDFHTFLRVEFDDRKSICFLYKFVIKK
jgi:hypothetical protein